MGEQWWAGQLVAEEEKEGQEEVQEGQEAEAGSLPFAASSKWRLRYQKYEAFEEEERTVVFLDPHLLLDFDDMQVLEWREDGSDYEPEMRQRPEFAAAERDDVVAIGDMAGADAVSEGMRELNKMPFDKQQIFASSYRVMADSFKQKLREILKNKGEGYVFGEEDVRTMIEGIKQQTGT
uniref:Uncharacterized protein n=1 Tax=Chloropicon laureae TaxID=464258 RepID=A0A7S2YY33_9CHLO|mmetsp:Transcript_11946/g.30953  ORF Transcript_11946/g.30953 Transcript_11946/m.30953 type:complete len:179 (+) Transcript_11946:152-688(+)